MKYVFLLCLIFAVTAVAVTATVCAILGALTMIEEIFKFVHRFCCWSIRKVRNFCRWVIRELREEVHQVDRQEEKGNKHTIKVSSIRGGLRR